MNFFWHDGLVQEFFSYAYALAGYFFSKSPTPPLPPPPSEVEWSGPNSIMHVYDKMLLVLKVTVYKSLSHYACYYYH